MKQSLLGLRFILGIGIIGFIIYLLLSFFMESLQIMTAFASSILLNLLGIVSTANGDVINFADMQARIIPLCVGDIEIAILIGAILSTEDRKIRDRILGSISAFFFILLINPIRIALTLSSWVWFGFPTVEFIHSILFRITLVIIIIGFYVAWYLWEPMKRGIAKLV